MIQLNIKDVFFKKKSGFFRSITIFESPQLGILKEIKIICKIVLMQSKNKPFLREFFFIRN